MGQTVQPATTAQARMLLPASESRRRSCWPGMRRNEGPSRAEEILLELGKALTVEVPGIEPGSFVVLMGLLRAQCASSLLGPTDHAHKSV
jgi:hypothetical protein